MRSVAHISDLHFGREDPVIAEALLKDLHAFQPSLVIVSGDLTQRASKVQFEAAAAFLKRIHLPLFIVPGNHDIPLYNILRRVFTPLKHYKKYISPDVGPAFNDGKIAVIGINTARSLAIKNGRISKKQIRLLSESISTVEKSIFTIVVTHHPLITPHARRMQKFVIRSNMALDALDESGVDLLLSGHKHKTYHGDIRDLRPTTKCSMILAQAGTAISERRRNEPNAYNIIRIKKGTVQVIVRAWNGTGFETATDTTYERVENKWVPSA